MGLTGVGLAMFLLAVDGIRMGTVLQAIMIAALSVIVLGSAFRLGAHEISTSGRWRALGVTAVITGSFTLLSVAVWLTWFLDGLGGDPLFVLSFAATLGAAVGSRASIYYVQSREREHALEKSEARYQSLTEDVLDTSRVGTIIVGPDNEVVWVNEAADEYFDLDRDETIGQDHGDLVDTGMSTRVENGERFAHHVLGSFHENTTVEEFDCHLTATANAHDRWLRHWSQPIQSGLYAGGRIQHYTDITVQRKREQQLDGMDRVLRHNLHNGMNVVLGAAESITNTTADDEIREYAEMITTSGRHLLDVTAKQRGIVELITEHPSTTSVDVERVARTCVDAQNAVWPDADITLTVRSTADACTMPHFDEALTELIENAIVHADDDQPTVAVTVDRTPTSVQLIVADTGPPIADSDVAILHGEPERGPLFHGSGMGLWFVNWIVAASDGTVTHRCNDPTGNVIQVDLPIATDQQHAPTARVNSD